MHRALILLLVGLTTISATQDGDHLGHLTRTIRDVGATQLAEMLQTVQPVIESIQDKCREANKMDVGNNIEATLNNAVRCIQTKVDPQRLTEEFQSAGRTGNLNQIYNKICSLWPEMHGCFNPVINEAKQCLNKEEQEALDTSIGIFDDSNDFFCENNHRRLKDFISDGGVQCVQALSPDLTKCVNAVYQEKKPKDKNKLVVDFDEEDCNEFQTLRGCIMKEVSRCSTESPKVIINDYLGLVQKVVCNSASTLTLFSTLNVLLVVCTYFYSKMF